MPAIDTTGGNYDLLSVNTVSQAQPFTISVVYYASTTGLGELFVDDPGGSLEGIHSALDGADTVTVYGGGADLFVSAPHNAWHTIQGTLNGASSDACLDGVSNAGATGAGTFNNNIDVFSNLNVARFFKGYYMECGWWGTAFSAGDQSAMDGNQSSYYGI